LFYVLQFELFYSKNQKIRGGGYLTKILKKNKPAISEIIKKYEIAAGNKDFSFSFRPEQMVNQTICLRVRGYKASRRKEIIEDIKDMYTEEEEGPEFDKVIPDLIIMKY